MSNGGQKNIICTLHIGAYSLHREKLTGGYLLQCSSRKNIIHTNHSKIHCLTLAHITNIELHLMSHTTTIRLQEMTHIILFLFITTKDTYFLNITVKKAAKYRITKTTRTSSYQEGFVFKY